MCQTGVEMFEYRLPQSPVENKVLLSHGSGVPVCKPSRINGHAVDVASLPVGLAAETELNIFKARSRADLPVSSLEQTKTVFHNKLSTTKSLSRQGMLSKKERKIKSEKNGLFTADNKMSFEERVKSKFKLRKTLENVEDPDDPYAFPEPSIEGPEPAVISTSNSLSPSMATPNSQQASPTPVEIGSLSQQDSPLSLDSPGNSSGSAISCGQPSVLSGLVSSGLINTTTTLTTTNPSNSGTSSIAKLYPELAEKLERVKPRLENKVKGRSHGSSTVNRLQTKIAQNRIKDKLKRTHSQDVTSPQRSPVCTPPQRSPVPLEVNLAITKDSIGDGLKQESKSPNLPDNYTYDGASIRPPPGPVAGLVGSMPPPPPPLMGFQNLERFPDHVISPASLSSSTGTPGKPGLMPPPPPYPGIAHRSSGFHSPTDVVANKIPLRTLSSQCPFFPTKETGFTQNNKQPTPAFLSTVIPVLRTLPRKPKQVLSTTEAKAKLKTDSALRYYVQHVCTKIKNHHYLPFDVAASDDEEEKSDNEDILPWQQDWFSASSDEEEDEPDDELALHIRTTKLALMRARLRRQFSQSRKSHRSNLNSHTAYNQTALAMIRASREQPSASIKTISIIQHLKKSSHRKKRKGEKGRPCRHKNDEEVQCNHTALPFANHCRKHIMYNVDQQLFDYCTAKFADNTQCCIPVFDIRHELPLCPEHAAKADNYNKGLGTEQKTKPRKKTRPSALTKPPKKGKKKKNQRRNIRPQKPIPTDEPSGNTEMPMDIPGEDCDVKGSVSNEGSSLPPTPPVSPTVDPPTPARPSQPSTQAGQSTAPRPFEPELPAVLEFSADMSSVVNDVMNKNFELPLEQASRLLEEGDLHDVLLQDDAFDIFGGRNGEYEPSREETEALERALAEASQEVKDTLEKLSQSMVSGELSSQFPSSLLSQSMNPPVVDQSPISGNMVVTSDSSSPKTPSRVNGIPMVPVTSQPAHPMYNEPHTAPPGYTQHLYPQSKQYSQTRSVSNLHSINSQTFVPYTTSSGPVVASDRHLGLGLSGDTPSPAVLPDYQDRTLRQQLSVTVPQSPLSIHRHAHLAGSPISSSPGRPGSTGVSIASPLPSHGIQSPVQTHSPMASPLANSNSGWNSAQINSNNQTPMFPGYHNGFPVTNGAYSYQVAPGSLKYSLNQQVKVESPHFLPPTHSSTGNQPLASNFDKGNSGGTKIT